MQRTLLFIGLAILIVGAAYLAFGRASPPAQQTISLNERITPENRDRLLQFVRSNEGIPFEDRLLFARGMQRVFLGAGNDGKTVGEVIEEQRKFERDFAQQWKKTHHPPAPPPKKTAR